MPKQAQIACKLIGDKLGLRIFAAKTESLI